MKHLMLACIAYLFAACNQSNEYPFEKGFFPSIPSNFYAVNSEFDDYNSTAPYYSFNFPFCFSSNRNSRGNNFDIIYKEVYVSFSKETGLLSINENYDENLSSLQWNEKRKLTEGLKKINTSANQFGPNMLRYGLIDVMTEGRIMEENTYIFLYSDDSEGTQNIKYIHNTTNGIYQGPFSANLFNSTAHDAYPTFNHDKSQVYFMSKRDGQYDIYCAYLAVYGDLIAQLNGYNRQIYKDTDLSSPYDDNCPFIIHDFMVFASNRPGGYGKYDLYYSSYINGRWTMPQNFGPEINSEYDEFRPIVLSDQNFLNNLMIFSSNRPGGKGGFDLYYVGIN